MSALDRALATLRKLGDDFGDISLRREHQAATEVVVAAIHELQQHPLHTITVGENGPIDHDAVAAVVRVVKERDDARAELARKTPVVDAARVLVELIVQPPNDCNEGESAEMALALAVDALDGGVFKAPAQPRRWHVAPDNAAVEHAVKLTQERDEAREWVRRLTSAERVLTCVYCGEAYPPGTPTHGAEVLTAHVRTCDKHPLRTIERQRDEARALLTRLVAALERRVLPAIHLDGICDEAREAVERWSR